MKRGGGHITTAAYMGVMLKDQRERERERERDTNTTMLAMSMKLVVVFHLSVSR
jgi:hypothetical protein